MNKILLIVRREYLTRVRKRSFLIVTFLVPVLFMGMISLSVYLAINQGGFSDKKKVEVVDESGWFSGKLADSRTIHYSYSSDFQAAKKSIENEDHDYLLRIPATLTNVQLLGKRTPSTLITSKIEDELTNVARDKRLSIAHIDAQVLADAQKPITIDARQLTEAGEKDAHVSASYAVGMLCAILIYITLFLYGAQVMRGVIEEKVSRIIEVIISSVKPFQLMMGKIIGVGMVGLTQFLLWIVLSFGLTSVGGSLLMNKGRAGMMQMQETQNISNNGTSKAMQAANTMSNDDTAQGFLNSLQSLPVAEIVICFLFYFLFGYLLYSALFAAVGSAVDNETETQQFMLPVTLPLIFTFMLSQSVIINNPDSSLAIWLSMIPFTSPIAMMIRIPFGVPVWQIAVSMVLMVLGFLFTTWVAARIYRVGILMYGKKATYKELAKWFMYKD